jgi:excisionase family DNA binding protein
VENRTENIVLTTQEACDYLRISRPTYLKYLYLGKIKGAKVGKGWKVLKSELDRFLKGEDRYSVAQRTNMLDREESGGEIW